MTDDALSMTPTEVLAGSDRLVACRDVIRGGAGVIKEPVPEIPEDLHGLRDAFVAFEAARSGFDSAFADALQAASLRLAGYAMDVLHADGSSPFVSLPAVAAPGERMGRP
jgi:hypothetical protein